MNGDKSKEFLYTLLLKDCFSNQFDEIESELQNKIKSIVAKLGLATKKRYKL